MFQDVPVAVECLNIVIPDFGSGNMKVEPGNICAFVDSDVPRVNAIILNFRMSLCVRIVVSER